MQEVGQSVDHVDRLELTGDTDRQAFMGELVEHVWSYDFVEDRTPRLTWIQATSAGGVRARLRRVAGCATPSGSAGHAGETANLKLTFHLDHSAECLLNSPRQRQDASTPLSKAYATGASAPMRLLQH